MRFAYVTTCLQVAQPPEQHAGAVHSHGVHRAIQRHVPQQGGVGWVPHRNVIQQVPSLRHVRYGAGTRAIFDVTRPCFRTHANDKVAGWQSVEGRTDSGARWRGCACAYCIKITCSMYSGWCSGASISLMVPSSSSSGAPLHVRAADGGKAQQNGYGVAWVTLCVIHRAGRVFAVHFAPATVHGGWGGGVATKQW